jgi:hypothetical protein
MGGNSRGLTIEIPQTELSRDAILSLPVIHPDGSVSVGESRDDWIVVNTSISDSERLVDFVDTATTVS